MADRLEITGWDVQRWGGGSDRRANDLPTGWTVVFGQNEEGKSSVAAALAWLLAGPGSRKELQRFGLADEPFQASLYGTLRGESLHIAVSPQVLSRTSTGDYSETLTGDLGGRVINRAALRTILGGIRHDEYRSYYWVDAERIPEDKERTGEVGDRSLFANIAFGDLDPFGWAETLKDRSDENFGRREGKTAKKGSVCHLAYDAGLAQLRLTKVAGYQKEWARKKVDLDDAEKSHGDAKKAREKCKTEIRDLDTALKARETFDAFKKAQETLAEFDPPTPNDRTLKASETRVRDANQHFKSAREALELAEGRLPKEEAECGPWVDLVGDVDSTQARIKGVGQAEERLRTRLNDLSGARERANAVGTAVTVETSGGLRTLLASLGVACVLALATVVAAVVDGSIVLTAILGVSTATSLIAAVWNLRPSVRSDDPAKVAQNQLAAVKSEAEDALLTRNNLLTDAGIPEDLVDDEDMYTEDRLEALATLRATREECTRLVGKVEEKAEVLQNLFLPMEIEATAAGEVLGLAIDRVEKHLEATNENTTRSLALRDEVGGEVGGKKPKAQQFLEENDDAQLERLRDVENNRLPDLELRVTTTGDTVDELKGQLQQIDSNEDYLGSEADLEGKRAVIRRRTIIGLADRLSIQLLEHTADTHLGDNTGKIVKRASDLATKVAADWSDIRTVGDDSEKRLIVEGSNGNFQDDLLSTGGRSLLNLTFRLATINVEAKRLPVLLPVILDDPFVHLDDTRRAAAFAMLNEFSTAHQILYFTCHKQHAQMAEAAGANRVDLH
jgi:uncharacterized protein YhaN